MAEWIKFSVTELELFCKKYEEEEKKEKEKVIQRFVSHHHLSYTVWTMYTLTMFVRGQLQGTASAVLCILSHVHNGGRKTGLQTRGTR